MGVYKSNNLVLTTIAREDYDENYGFEFCPQINAAYNLPNLALRASAGRSIRAEIFPTNKEIGVTWHSTFFML